MTWTKEPPTEPGWYWKREIREGRIMSSEMVEVEIAESGEVLYTYHADYDGAFRSTPGWNEWAGPIPEPQEPEVTPDA